MAVKAVQLNNRNEFAAKYVKGEVNQFFSYHPFEANEQRLKDLQQRSFNRRQLVEVLQAINRDFDAPDETMRMIDRLNDSQSVVVIGGQQAGLLTGPLYTIHKIISIIQYAKEQEEQLNIPVIPVFWIAGEDHDYDEINHVYTTANDRLNKLIIPQEEWLRKPISDVQIDKALATDLIKRVFHDLKETEYTRNLSTVIFEQLENSDTFVDFFARLIFQIFDESGLVLVDSGDKRLRRIESEIFEQLIYQQEAISESIYSTAQQLQQDGFAVQVDVTKYDAHLFYHDKNNERILLVREGSKWVGKNDEVSFTTNELLDIAKNEPHLLSNNVMTRPIMQEALFPTLAFIAGDGEISYWGLLKNAFQAYNEGFKVPPVVPRLSITLITERIDKLIEHRNLNASYIINHGCQQAKVNWLSTQQNPPIHLLFDQVEQEVTNIHEPIQTIAHSIGPDLGAEAERNLQNIVREINYMKNRTIRQMEKKYTKQLSAYQEIQLALRPDDVLQERVLSIVSFLNECGPSFITQLLNKKLSFTRDHHLIYVYKLS